MAPTDLPLTANATPGPSISSGHPGGVNLLLADGSVGFLGDDAAPSVLSSILTISGGEPPVALDAR